MTRITRIKQKLDVLKPQYLEIIDETPKHSGHFESETLLETHLVIKISTDNLYNLSLVAQHKIINDLLKEEFQDGLHALSIRILKKSTQ